MQRILPDSALLGQQTLLVDAQGDGDYTTIQAALNEAAEHATASSRWSVRVAPGVYSGQVTLKSYVDLVGLAPGRAAMLTRNSGVVLVAEGSCTVANLWLQSVDSPALVLGSGFSGLLELDGVIIDQTYLDVPPISQAGGQLHIYRSRLASGGALHLAGGSLAMYASILRNQATADGGENMALYLQGGSAVLEGCLVENVSPAGYGVYIDGAIDGFTARHCTFRKVDATYAIHASQSVSACLACCCGNGPLHPNLAGYHDYVYAASI
jgi:hypothetical protein